MCASCGYPEITLRFAAVAEAAPRRAVDLVILVTLAGDQHDVACAGLLEGRADGFAAVMDDARGMHPDAAADGAGDGLGILGARVVVGHDDLVGQFIGDAAHGGPLAGIAVAAAAEH